MGDMIRETAVVLVVTVDLAVAATLVAIVLSVWLHISKRGHI